MSAAFVPLPPLAEHCSPPVAEHEEVLEPTYGFDQVIVIDFAADPAVKETEPLVPVAIPAL